MILAPSSGEESLRAVEVPPPPEDVRLEVAANVEDGGAALEGLQKQGIFHVSGTPSGNSLATTGTRTAGGGADTTADAVVAGDVEVADAVAWDWCFSVPSILLINNEYDEHNKQNPATAAVSIFLCWIRPG